MTQARQLRRNQTDAEKRFWSAVRDRKLAGAKFWRQVPINDFVVEFLCQEHKLIVEIDGGQHAGSDADLARTQQLEALGFRVVRYWNNEVLGNLEGVLAHLQSVLTPSPGGRGLG